MFKFTLSLVLLAGTLAGLTIAAAPSFGAHASAAPTSASFTTAGPIGPFGTYDAAFVHKLILESSGKMVTDPYELNGGWWIDLIDPAELRAM